MDEKVLKYVHDAIFSNENPKPQVDKTVHETMRALYLQYLIVGGMPEAVNKFFETHDLNQVREIQKQILNSIKDDFGRCKAADGLQYLIDVGLVVKICNTRELKYPLETAKIANEFKIFYIDTGLLVSQLEDDVPYKILKGDLCAYKGAVAENMVASVFAKTGEKLFYFHAPSGSPELDFLFEKDGEAVIVECKSSNNRATSMKYVLANPKKYGSHPAVKIAAANLGGGKGFETYPLYALGFFEKPQQAKIVPEIDVKNLKVPD